MVVYTPLHVPTVQRPEEWPVAPPLQLLAGQVRDWLPFLLAAIRLAAASHNSHNKKGRPPDPVRWDGLCDS